MPLQLITAPAKEPVTTADLKQWARIFVDEDDQLVTTLIKAARSYLETKLRRSLITQTWAKSLDAFPGPTLTGLPYLRPFSIPSNAIVLERPPVQQIVSIQYLSLSGVIKTLTAGTDYVDLTAGGTQRSDFPLRITPPFGKVWPADVMPQIGAVTVTYKAGYGDDATNIPPDILNWLLLRASTLYENREECVVGTRITVAELPYVDSLIDPWVVELY